MKFDNTISGLNQYLTFLLGKEVFALEISQVREVLELPAITSIPRLPEFMRGVINLRGSAVPVMELRRKLSMSASKDTVNTCIIIVDILMCEETITIGILVDSVKEVFEASPESIEPAPKMGASVKADYIKGMGRQDDQFVIIVDINMVFSDEELAMASEVPPMGKDSEPAMEVAA